MSPVRFDKRHSGPYFYLAIAVIVFALYSLTIATTTIDKCAKGVDRTWQVVPPEWKCNGRLPGYG